MTEISVEREQAAPENGVGVCRVVEVGVQQKFSKSEMCAYTSHDGEIKGTSQHGHRSFR